MSPVRVDLSSPANIHVVFPNGVRDMPISSFAEGYEPHVSCAKDGRKATLSHPSLRAPIVVSEDRRINRGTIRAFLDGGVRDCQIDVTLTLKDARKEKK